MNMSEPMTPRDRYVEVLEGEVAYIARKYQRPMGSTSPQHNGSGTIEPWHAVRVLGGTAERKPVCRQGAGALEAPYLEWNDFGIASSRCAECNALVAAERDNPTGAPPADWMYYIDGATLADLRLETDADGNPSWILWYRLDPREPREGEIPSPVHRKVEPPSPLGLHDGDALVIEVEASLARHYNVTREPDDSPEVVAAWRLSPL
jgi:hypothetical protein